MPIYTSRQLLDPTYITNQMKNQAQSEKDTWTALAGIGKDVADWYKENKLKKEWKDTTDQLLANEEFSNDPTYKALVYQANKSRDLSPVTNYVQGIRQQKSTEKMANMNAEQEKLKGVYEAQTSFNQAKDAYNYSKAKGDTEGMNNALDSMKRANRQSTWYGGPEFELPTSQSETTTTQSETSIVETPEQIAAKEKERTDLIAGFNTRIGTLKQKQPGKKAKRNEIIAFNTEIDKLVKDAEAAGIELGELDNLPSLQTVPPSEEEIAVAKQKDRSKAEEIANEQMNDYTETGLWSNPVETKYFKVYQGKITEKKK